MPKFEATVDAAAVRNQILVLGREADTLLGRALEKVGRDAVARLRADAPTGRTGATVKGINIKTEQGRVATAGNFSVFGGGRSFVITGSARDKNTGYDYFDVTRFGHQQLYIVPQNRKVLAYEGAGKYRGSFFLKNSVKGQNPRRDWARNGLIIAGLAARDEGVKISRKLELTGL